MAVRKPFVNVNGTLTELPTGDQTSIVGITGTITEFNAAVTDADLATLGANAFTSTQTLSSTAINTARSNVAQHATTMNFWAAAVGNVLDGTGAGVTITAIANAPQAGASRDFYPLTGTILTQGATFDIDGAVTRTSAGGECWTFVAKSTSTYRVFVRKADGTAVVVAAAGFTLGTPVATTSGTSINFTGIPAGTKQIKISLVGVSTNGTSNMLIQIGDDGGVEITDYASTAQILLPASGGSSANGFRITHALAAIDRIHGIITLFLENSTSFRWTSTGGLTNNATVMYASAGSKALSQELSSVRLTTINGTDVFDAGEVNIAYI